MEGGPSTRGADFSPADMKYLIDTDWIIDHIQGNPAATALMLPLTPAGIAISIIL